MQKKNYSLRFCIVNVFIFSTRQREANISMPVCAVKRNINIKSVISTNSAFILIYL